MIFRFVSLDISPPVSSWISLSDAKRAVFTEAHPNARKSNPTRNCHQFINEKSQKAIAKDPSPMIHGT